MKGKDNNSLNKILKKRTFSFLIDLLAIHYINKGFILSYEHFLKSFFLLPLSISQEISENLGKLSLATLPFIFLAYFTMMYYLGDGQTIGKFLLNLKIKETKNNRLTLLNCLMRSLGYFFCYFIGLFLFLIPFITKDAKGIQDWISGTEVQDKTTTKRKTENDGQLDLFRAS